MSKYVLISAVRNEQAFLDDLVSCVVSQTIKPVRWLIVDDGSTDATYEIATTAAQTHPFMSVLRMPPGRPRSFSSQVYAAQHGFASVASEAFDFVGFLDADIRFQPDYYERQVRLMSEDHTVGLTGGSVVDQHKTHTTNIRSGSEDYHVPGGVQFFRRECFEKIGGYVAIEGGGQDTIADIMVMMHGWKVRVDTANVALHLRPDGVNCEDVLQRGVSWGRKFYRLGYHPLYFLAQNIRRWKQAPIGLAALFPLVGYVLAAVRRDRRPVGTEFIEFLRSVQMRRLRQRLLLQLTPRTSPDLQS